MNVFNTDVSIHFCAMVSSNTYAWAKLHVQQMLLHILSNKAEDQTSLKIVQQIVISLST